MQLLEVVIDRLKQTRASGCSKHQQLFVQEEDSGRKEKAGLSLDVEEVCSQQQLDDRLRLELKWRQRGRSVIIALLVIKVLREKTTEATETAHE